MVRYLDRELSPLLRDGRYDATTGRALLSATAELAQLAGWQAYDMAEHGIAQRYLVLALDLARSAHDDSLGAEILAAMSHQATYLADTATGVDLARAAGQTAKRAGVRALVAEALVLEAHAHARAGDGYTAELVQRAEDPRPRPRRRRPDLRHRPACRREDP